MALRLDEHPASRWRPQLSAVQFQKLLQNLTAVKIRATFGENGGSEGGVTREQVDLVLVLTQLFVSLQDVVTWTTCNWWGPGEGATVSQPTGCRPAAARPGTRASSVSRVWTGSDAVTPRPEPSAPASAAAAEGAAATR